MFKHILVPVDDHPACVNAAQHAFDLTRVLGGQVTLIHLLGPNSEGTQTYAERHLERLARRARRLPTQVILPVAGQDAVDALATYATSHRVDLIVLGVSGEGGLVDAALGQVAATLTRVSGIPVHLSGGRQLQQTGAGRWQRVVDAAI
ncbi:universal stress protein [Deinococcus hohokamensis]|uniref:Universal stress protein n=1 Tax=Deinococcus hohokamensis TaxID=309883 RepID=A0ABV9I6H5_9DEIO